MAEILIKVRGKVATSDKRYLLSSNSNYVLSFDLDDEWSAQAVKTARVIYDGTYIDLAFTGSSVTMPKVPLCSSLSVGLFTGTLATNAVDIGCICSVADFDGQAAVEFTVSQYDQIVQLLNSVDLRQIQSITEQDGSMVISFNDGSSERIEMPQAVSVENAQINSSGRLLITLTDDSTIDCGVVKGDTGAVPSFSVGEVKTLEAGESAAASISGTAEAPVLSLSIPRGDKGDTGQGATPEDIQAALMRLCTDIEQYGAEQAALYENAAMAQRGYRLYGKDSFELPASSTYTVTAAQGAQFEENIFVSSLMHKTMDAGDAAAGTYTPNSFSGSAVRLSFSRFVDIHQINGFKDDNQLEELIFPRTLTNAVSNTMISGEKWYQPSGIVGSWCGGANVREVYLLDCAQISIANFDSTCLETVVLARESGITTLGSTQNFRGGTLAAGTGFIYVPSALLEQYKTATNWVSFAGSFRAIEDYPEIVRKIKEIREGIVW